MTPEHDKPEALRIKQEADARERERLEALKELEKTERGREKGADLAPSQNETPAEEHRGGALPNTKR